ncbi:MAG: hypothetical protein EBR82_10530 [Caulobacteraceae bacterium]|nr:hypothetical protein [Caulobacteraceae bacterium]
MSKSNCITHHYACDCREAKFAELERENAGLKVQIRELIATMEEEGEMDAVRIAELKKENAALKKLIIEVGYIITYFNDEVALCRDPWHRPKEAQP